MLTNCCVTRHYYHKVESPQRRFKEKLIPELTGEPRIPRMTRETGSLNCQFGSVQIRAIGDNRTNSQSARWVDNQRELTVYATFAAELPA